MSREMLITFDAAAKLVGPGITARHLRKWYQEGRLEAQKIGCVWHTTETKLQEAIERGWQSSSYTAQIASTGPVPSHACDATSGISRGTKDEGAASVARAMDTLKKIMQKNLSQNLSCRSPQDGMGVINFEQHSHQK